MEFKYESLSPSNKLALEEKNITYFILILPTLTLGPTIAPFLFPPDDIDNMSKILAVIYQQSESSKNQYKYNNQTIVAFFLSLHLL